MKEAEFIHNKGLNFQLGDKVKILIPVMSNETQGIVVSEEVSVYDPEMVSDIAVKTNSNALYSFSPRDIKLI